MYADMRVIIHDATKQLSGYLVDIHGQHEYQSLLNNKNHLGFLDFLATSQQVLLTEAEQNVTAGGKSNGTSNRSMGKRPAEERMSRRAQPNWTRLNWNGEEAMPSQQRAKLADAVNMCWKPPIKT